MKAYSAPTGNSYDQIQELRELFLGTMGKTFRVLFVSRGRNEVRDMRARLRRIDRTTVEEDRRNHQFHVWDVVKRDWRIVPLERVAAFRCGSVEWYSSVSSMSAKGGAS